MKLFPEYQKDIEKIIGTLSTAYYKSIKIDRDDLIQELWLFVIQKDFDNIRILYTAVKNYCNRLYYNNNVRFGKKDHLDCNMEFSDFDEAYIAFEQAAYNEDDRFSELSGEFAFKSLIKNLDKKTHDYVITKIYLSGDYPNLRDKYELIIQESNISDEQKTELEITQYNDDLIARYILGYQNGTHSGSFRNIRSNLKLLFRDLCIY